MHEWLYSNHYALPFTRVQKRFSVSRIRQHALIKTVIGLATCIFGFFRYFFGFPRTYEAGSEIGHV